MPGYCVHLARMIVQEHIAACHLDILKKACDVNPIFNFMEIYHG